MAKEVKFLKLDFEVLDKTVRYVDIVDVAGVVVCDAGCTESVWLVEWSVSSATDGEPP